MSESEKILGMRWIPQDGTKVRDITSGERYCAFCGEEAKGLAIERFGEVFCSEAHAEQFVKEVRAARVQAAAAALRAPEAPTESPQPPAPPGAAPSRRSTSRRTATPSSGDVVTSTAGDVGPCSAWPRRSMARA